MANIVHPRGRLEDHDGDIELLPRQFLKLSLFAGLKKPPDLDKFPGSLVIRHYRRKEELFRQGEPGWTAFYILTLEDILIMRQLQLEITREPDRRRELQAEIERLQLAVQTRGEIPEDDPERQVASVHLAQLRKRDPKHSVMAMERVKSRPSAPIKNRMNQTVYIPFGGPQTISWDTGRVPLFEGDLFGEMSCLYRTPRSATIVADRDCYMIELLRSILDKVYKDPVYKARADKVYLKRVFELQVRKLPIFRDLTPEEFKEIQSGVELASFEPGDLICDEHDRSDCMYIVRQGLVKVMKNISYLLSLADVSDWAYLIEALRNGARNAASPHGKFWLLLPEKFRTLLQNTPNAAQISPSDRKELVCALNDVLKDHKTTDAAEFKPIIDSEFFKAQLTEVPANRKEWSERTYRQVNRFLFETLYPRGVRQFKKHAGIETIMSYCSPDDYFGETGLMLDHPRNASCIAFSHPNYKGTVELVKIPAKTFWRLMKLSTNVRDKVKQEVAERRKQMLMNIGRPIWDESNQVQFSQQFSELGLIQGQQLMLIDLDRCTRCDECVKACVNTHTDGHSRLFLDGPRFGKYLVPTACRSCLDPVCMIPCPVASIRRGANREIIIEDWCIGCEACAENCPYGSIQMYDLGLIPEERRGWRFMPGAARAAAGDWFKPGFNDKKWLSGKTPFLWDRDMQTALVEHSPPDTGDGQALERLVNFRYEFEVPRGQLTPTSNFKFEVQAMGGVAHIWLNGRELKLDDRVKRGRHEYSVPPPPEKPPAPAKDAKEPPPPPAPRPKPPPATDFLRAGRNVVTVQVKPPAKGGEILFQLRLDEIKKPKELPAEVDESVADEVFEKIVTHRAVVCDLCSKIGGIPACVHACPHDAAMRVNARKDFPASY